MENPCRQKTEKCANCHSHFSEMRPSIIKAEVTHAFKKDFQDHETILREILDCSHINYIELHKFERKIRDTYIFRAKKDKIHFVYAIHQHKLILLRAFKNFHEYGKYLLNEKEILNSID